jgi:hypothetical protein
MKNYRWKLTMGFGWYRGETPVGFSLSLFEPIEDYPSGWMSFYFISLQVAKFSFSFGIDKVDKE